MPEKFVSVDEFFESCDDDSVKIRPSIRKHPDRLPKDCSVEIAMIMKIEKVARKEAAAILKRRLAE